jgi:hypothetical protein
MFKPLLENVHVPKLPIFRSGTSYKMLDLWLASNLIYIYAIQNLSSNNFVMVYPNIYQDFLFYHIQTGHLPKPKVC